MRIENLHHIVESVVNGLSIAFNIVLLYLIKNHSNFGTPLYQLLLAVDASLDMALATLVFLEQPVCLTGGGYKVFISNGFFAGLSDAVDRFLMFLFLSVLHYNVMWISIQFVCRYAYLCLRDRARDATRIFRIVTVFSAFWAIIGTVMCYIYTHRPHEFEHSALHALELNHWEISNIAPVVMGSHITEWLLPAWMFMWSVSSIGGTVVVVVFEAKINRHIRSMGNSSHDNTRRMHRDFHRALLAMAICPLVTTVVPIVYYLIATFLEYSPGPIVAFMSMAPSSITMFNPLTTIFFMRTYRMVLLRPFIKKRVHKMAQDTRVTGLEMASSTFPISN